MGELLDRQYQYFVKNKSELLKKYEGQYIVIHNEEVVDSFGNERDAYIYCVQHFKMGTFFIQQVLPGNIGHY
jgi:hypothetical protein